MEYKEINLRLCYNWSLLDIFNSFESLLYKGDLYVYIESSLEAPVFGAFKSGQVSYVCFLHKWVPWPNQLSTIAIGISVKLQLRGLEDRGLIKK